MYFRGKEITIPLSCDKIDSFWAIYLMPINPISVVNKQKLQEIW